MTQISKTFQFAEKASMPKNAIALIYDLEGFSRFFNQADVQEYVPAFLNHVSDAISRILFGGTAYWSTAKEGSNLIPLNLTVAHEKFMGDGALYILLPPAGEADFSNEHLRFLCNRLWNLKNHFGVEVFQSCLDKVPVAELPKKIRFGVARGPVYELDSTGAPSEYIGTCVNLASRLQGYCSDLGFIASARLMIPTKMLVEHGYKKVVATKLKGFPKEIVVVDSNEYAKLDQKLRSEIFEEIGAK